MSEEAIYRNRFRQNRLKRLLPMIDDIVAAAGTCSILDLGGKVNYWNRYGATGRATSRR
jgi:hypothetical protein